MADEKNKTERSRSESREAKRLRPGSDSVEGSKDELTLLREEIRDLKNTLTELVTGVSCAVNELGSRMDKFEERFEQVDRRMKEQCDVVTKV